MSTINKLSRRLQALERELPSGHAVCVGWRPDPAGIPGIVFFHAGEVPADVTPGHPRRLEPDEWAKLAQESRRLQGPHLVP